MAEFVKKAALGGYKLVPGGHSDPECEYVIMTKKEYDQLLDEKAQAEQESRNIKYDAEKTIREIQQNAVYTVRKITHDAQKAVDEIKEKLDDERIESAHQRALNENLLRIAKERANADRNLRPKKDHTGYVVLSSTEKEYRYRDRGSWKTVRLWETVLETPYSVDFLEEQVKVQMRELTDSEGGPCLVGRLGIQSYYDGKYEDMLNDNAGVIKIKEDSNIMLEKRLRANYRSGYWEVFFFHTKPLGIVPGDMRTR